MDIRASDKNMLQYLSCKEIYEILRLAEFVTFLMKTAAGILVQIALRPDARFGLYKLQPMSFVSIALALYA